MTRIISFADGFTSSTAPIIAGSATLETFTIANNTTGGSVLTFDKDLYKTIFAEYEIKRSDVGGTYIQAGTIIFTYSGTSWSLVPGNYTGIDMLRDPSESIANAYEVKLSINSSTGVVTYSSGSMGGSYSGTLKLNLTRISV